MNVLWPCAALYTNKVGYSTVSGDDSCLIFFPLVSSSSTVWRRFPGVMSNCKPPPSPGLLDNKPGLQGPLPSSFINPTQHSSQLALLIFIHQLTSSWTCRSFHKHCLFLHETRAYGLMSPKTSDRRYYGYALPVHHNSKVSTASRQPWELPVTIQSSFFDDRPAQGMCNSWM